MLCCSTAPYALWRNVRAAWSSHRAHTAAALGGQPRPLRTSLNGSCGRCVSEARGVQPLSARADPARSLTQLYSQSVMSESCARRRWFGALCWGGGQGHGAGAAALVPTCPATAVKHPPHVFELRIKTSAPLPSVSEDAEEADYAAWTIETPRFAAPPPPSPTWAADWDSAPLKPPGLRRLLKRSVSTRAPQPPPPSPRFFRRTKSAL